MKTTPEQRAAWRALLEAATKGSWRVRGQRLVSAVNGDVSCPIADLRAPYRRGVGLARGEKESAANGRLILASREALPGLLDDVDELERARIMHHEQAMTIADARYQALDEKRAAEARADALASLVGQALVLSTISPRRGERPGEPPTHALTLRIWEMVQEREAALASLADERSARVSAEHARDRNYQDYSAVMAERETWKARATAATAEVDRLRSFEPIARSVTVNGDGSVDAVFQVTEEHREEFAKFLVGLLECQEAPNYAELTVEVADPADGRKYAVTVQRCSGKTPHGFRLEAEAERDRLREALREWVAASDAERTAAKNAARVRVTEYRKWPDLPKRMPKNAVLVSSLPPEEQRRIAEQCAADMKPINEAEAIHAAARSRLALAQEAAKAWLSAMDGPTPSTSPAPRQLPPALRAALDAHRAGRQARAAEAAPSLLDEPKA